MTNIFSGVLTAYQDCIQRVKLSGPTNFVPVINRVVQKAEEFKDGTDYFILIIITDGCITDLPQTKKV
jgi:uncharacterized protein with von Willebrand factor type A (vWA) domain